MLDIPNADEKPMGNQYVTKTAMVVWTILQNVLIY